jgi:hypothetical protein
VQRNPIQVHLTSPRQSLLISDKLSGGRFARITTFWPLFATKRVITSPRAADLRRTNHGYRRSYRRNLDEVRILVRSIPSCSSIDFKHPQRRWISTSLTWKAGSHAFWAFVALTLLVAVRPLRGLHQAAISKMSNSLFTKRTSSLTRGLHVRQCPRRIIRITSNPFIVAAAVFMV